MFRIFLACSWHFKFGKEFIFDQNTWLRWTRVDRMENIKLFNLQLVGLLGAWVLLRRISRSVRNWFHFILGEKYVWILSFFGTGVVSSVAGGVIFDWLFHGREELLMSITSFLQFTDINTWLEWKRVHSLNSFFAVNLRVVINFDVKTFRLWIYMIFMVHILWTRRK